MPFMSISTLCIWNILSSQTTLLLNPVHKRLAAYYPQEYPNQENMMGWGLHVKGRRREKYHSCARYSASFSIQCNHKHLEHLFSLPSRTAHSSRLLPLPWKWPLKSAWLMRLSKKNRDIFIWCTKQTCVALVSEKVQCLLLFPAASQCSAPPGE